MLLLTEILTVKGLYVLVLCEMEYDVMCMRMNHVL